MKRPFAIEYRVKPGHWLVRLGTSNNWRICNRYAKEEDRDKALRALNRVPWMEYRAKV